MPLRVAAVLLLLTAKAALADDDGIKVSVEKTAGSDVPVNIAEGVIDAPPADVWKVVSQCGNYAKTMPRIVKSKELAREGDEASVWKVKCEITVHLPFPLSNLTGVTQATHTVDKDVKYTRAWTLVSGDYHMNTGSWTLVGIDEGKRTRATYRIQVNPKVALPTSWMASAQRSSLKDVILRLRETSKAVK